MATATAALRIPEDLSNRYDRLAKSTGRTKNFYMTEAIAAEIDRRLVARHASVRA